MGQASIRKKNGTTKFKTTKATQEKHAAGVVQKMYAEDFDEMLQEHRKGCTDANCDGSLIITRLPGVRVAPMVRVGSPKEVFLTINSEPFRAIQLLTGDETKPYFKDGNAVIECCPDHAPTDTAYLHQKCHPDAGVGLVTLPDNTVGLVCASGTEGKMCGKPMFIAKVAPRPKAELPFIFCSHHGIEHAYVVCIHVLDGAKPTRLSHPTDTKTGDAFCDPCAKLYEDSKFNDLRPLVHMACQTGVLARLGVKPMSKLVN